MSGRAHILYRLALALGILLAFGRAEATKTGKGTQADPYRWTTKKGVAFETWSVPMRPGAAKKAEWRRTVIGPNGKRSISGMSWGRPVKGTGRAFKNGNAIEQLNFLGGVGDRTVTTRTLADGKVIKTIRHADQTSSETTSWTEGDSKYMTVVEKDAKGAITATHTYIGDPEQ